MAPLWAAGRACPAGVPEAWSCRAELRGAGRCQRPRAAASSAAVPIIVASPRTAPAGPVPLAGVPVAPGAGDPMAPVDPVDPVAPIERVEPAEPMERTDPAEPTDRIEPAEPMERMDPAEPTERIEPEDASDPIDRMDRAEPIDPNEASDAIEKAETTEAPDRNERTDDDGRLAPVRPGSRTRAGTTRRAPAPRRRAGRPERRAADARAGRAATRVHGALGRDGTRGRGRTMGARYRPVRPALRSPVVAARSTSTVTARPLRKAIRAKSPTLAVERELWDAGHEVVVGVDEVGRGSWAGPLMVGAAVVPRYKRLYRVRDSKMLTEVEREALFDKVAAWCSTWAVGAVSQEECDELGMSAAQKLAARRAIEGLGVAPDRVLIDGRWDFVGGGVTRTIVKGDATCLSIAAASVLAKVTRDRWMRVEAEHYPGYNFEANKGYPCPRHKIALAGMGPTTIHRRTWVFMESIPWTGVPRRRPFGWEEPAEPQPTLFDDV
jgi:ribonuclease HII